ncbi:MAG: type I-C CRISPR-associated protein Cas8c/Csd1 [Rhodospirillales bacterium]|nr:type I-C CRISPR-associated protein Cas8c/Csd1 [Rhodospirillales bacterium]
MTILAELARLYDRLRAEGEAPPPGFSRERIGFELIFASDGRPVALEPLGDDDPDRPGRRMYVPMPPANRRGTKIVSGTFWDPAPYVLGIARSKKTGDFGPQFERAEAKREEFVRHHRRLIRNHSDPGLQAFLAFLDRWTSDEFSKRSWDASALSANIVFRWEADPAAPRFLHDRDAAIALLPKPSSMAPRKCLVTGKVEPAARLHPAIKGVDGAQSSGAPMVSFNDEAYTSFGADQGANAPIGTRTAFAYATALNVLLDRNAARQRRLKIGNSTVVFWADGDRNSAGDIESLFAETFDPPTSGDTEAELRTALANLAEGRAAAGRYDPATRVFVLGLAPNAARLSVRFWQIEGLDALARNILRFWEVLKIEPMPWKGPPAAWSLLYETALGGEAKTIPPRLAGELMRAVLGGQPLPRSLMSAVILRIRAGGRVNGRRVAICKAVVNGNREQEIIPVALNPDHPDPAYRLGRLFAMLEQAQRGALGRDINATIKDQYFTAASATPARVFPLLLRNSAHHLSRMRKSGSGGWATTIEKTVQEIYAGLGPQLPRSFNLDSQGLFMAGYYHQSEHRQFKRQDDAPGEEA